MSIHSPGAGLGTGVPSRFLDDLADDDDRDRDDGQLGKKRKVPSSQYAHDRDTYPLKPDPPPALPDATSTSAFPRRNGKWLLASQLLRSPSARAASFRKAMFLRRKAALITLFLDAQAVVTAELKKGVEKHSVNLPEVAVFEQMLPALEDIGVGQWAMDATGWRSAFEETKRPREAQAGRMAQWRRGFEKRRKLIDGRKAIVRGGWAPEGSFEVESLTNASAVMRANQKDQAGLAKLALVLRGITLSASPAKPQVVEEKPEEVRPERDRQADATSAAAAISAGGTAGGTVPAAIPGSGGGAGTAPAIAGTPMSKTNSSQGSDGKKKPKKKKRSVLANQSNPHHVDNYRPSRTVGASDPLEPYSSHANLLFPPPMRFLSVRPSPKGSTTPTPPVRAAEDDYLCTFCEYALFYGSEEARRRAIRARKRELKRRQTIKNRAKNVAEGKGKGNLGREEEEWDEDDEGDEGAEGGHCHGRCSCGRPLSGGGKAKKPPDDHHHDHNHAT